MFKKFSQCRLNNSQTKIHLVSSIRLVRSFRRNSGNAAEVGSLSATVIGAWRTDR